MPAPKVEELLTDSPKNWGRWGPDDEVGALNYLTRAEVLRGIAAVRKGQVFTLQVRMGDPAGDPLWPGRAQPTRVNLLDKGPICAARVRIFQARPSSPTT